MKIFRVELLSLIIFAFIFRLSLSFLPPFEIDQTAYRFWSDRISEFGFMNFYSGGFFANNTGYLYVLWFVGLIKKILFPEVILSISSYDLLLKLPSNIADIISGIIILKVISRRLNERLGILGFIMYVFNPAIFFNSSIWGQYDGFSTMLLLLAFYFLTEKRRPELSAVFLAIALTIKPQSVFLLPVTVMFSLLNFPVRRIAASVFVAFFTIFLVYFPFFPTDPIGGLIKVNLQTADLFTCTTCFAFNFWGVFGNWENDMQTFIHLPLFIWGLILFTISQFAVFIGKFDFSLKRIRLVLGKSKIYLTTSLSIFAGFIFLTRMHERYLFATFPFLLVAAIVMHSKILKAIYFIVSIVYVLDLYLPYSYYNNKMTLIKPLARFLWEYFNLFSVFLLGIFLFMLFYFQRIISNENTKSSLKRIFCL